MQIVGQIFRGISLICKLVGIILCIYYIYKYNEYKLAWNFSIWLMSSWMTTLNSILATCGTFILVLPLTILIMSLFTTNTFINLMSMFFSISGGIVSIMLALKNGTLEEFSNFKLFIIYHAVTLEEKRMIFIKEYKIAMVTLAEESAKKLEYLQAKLSDTYMAVYENALIKMPAKDIKSYAINTVNDLLVNYENKQPGILKRIGSGITTFIYNHPQAIGYTILTLVVLVGGYKIIKVFSQDNEPLIALTKINLDAAKVSEQATKIIADNVKLDEGIVKCITGMVNEILGPMAKVQTNLVTKIHVISSAINEQKLDINNLDKAVKQILDIIKRLKTKLENDNNFI